MIVSDPRPILDPRIAAVLDAIDARLAALLATARASPDADALNARADAMDAALAEARAIAGATPQTERRVA